jgi:D-alanyl-D-alanine dipeptidase
MYNIGIRRHLTWFPILFFCLPCFAQQTGTQSLTVIKDVNKFQEVVQADSTKGMVSLKTIPNIKLDLVYATNNNFTGSKLYPGKTSNTFLRLPAARAILALAKELAKDSLAIQIFDAYRPYKVTVKIWKLVQDEKYAANPAKGSNHNRGTAIDLTLVDMRTGKMLPMGTDYDNFSQAAHHNFKDLPPEVLNNRKKLLTLMEKYGFEPIETEWWHYGWVDDRNYEVLDIDFQEMEKVSTVIENR